MSDQDKTDDTSPEPSLLDRLIEVYEKRYASQLGLVQVERCPMCGRVYRAKSGLAVHARTVHGLTERAEFHHDFRKNIQARRKNQDKPYVLAIDPGKLSGIALFQKADFDNGDRPTLMWSDELPWPQIGTRVEATLNTLYAKVDVVVERFIITTSTATKTQAPWSLEVIGAVRWLAYKANAGELIMQEPASVMKFMPNKRLKDIGMWHVGGAGHALDAIRHGVVFLINKEGWRPTMLLPESTRGRKRVDWTRQLPGDTG